MGGKEGRREAVMEEGRIGKSIHSDPRNTF